MDSTTQLGKEFCMLVLSRKKNEQIVIPLPTGELIIIALVEIRGDKVRLGIEAPKEIEVHREEVFDAIQRDGKRDEKRDDLDGKKDQDDRPAA